MLRELWKRHPEQCSIRCKLPICQKTAPAVLRANALLCRVGSLYHDIRKNQQPTIFLPKIRRPDSIRIPLLNPRESARIIIQHVEDGKSMAKKFGLPTLVSDFIETHHGRTRTEGFLYGVVQRRRRS